MQVEMQFGRGQLGFLSTPKPFAAFVGGVWSGKTYVGCSRIARAVFEQPGHEHTFWCPTMGLARGKPLKVMREVLHRWGIRHTKTHPSEGIRLDCGKRGVVYLRSYHNIDSIRSFDCTTQIVDELDHYPCDRAEEAFHQIIARGRGGRVFIGAVGTSDKGTTGFMHKFFHQNEDDNDVALIHAHTQENVWAEGVTEYIERNRSQ